MTVSALTTLYENFWGFAFLNLGIGVLLGILLSAMMDMINRKR